MFYCCRVLYLVVFLFVQCSGMVYFHLATVGLIDFLEIIEVVLFFYRGVFSLCQLSHLTHFENSRKWYIVPQ